MLQLHHAGCAALARNSVTKVGFDLRQDLVLLRRRLGVDASPVLDLAQVFHRMGDARRLGIKSALAVVFGQRFVKSKRVSTGNWANRTLQPRQRLYAANDAYGALQVLLALQRQGVPLCAEAGRWRGFRLNPNPARCLLRPDNCYYQDAILMKRNTHLQCQPANT